MARTPPFELSSPRRVIRRGQREKEKNVRTSGNIVRRNGRLLLHEGGVGLALRREDGGVERKGGPEGQCRRHEATTSA